MAGFTSNNTPKLGLGTKSTRVECREIFLQSDSLQVRIIIKLIYVLLYFFIAVGSFNSELTKPRLKSRAHLCPLKAFMSLSISEYCNSCFRVPAGAALDVEFS
jgi:hypothetical protein